MKKSKQELLFKHYDLEQQLLQELIRLQQVKDYDWVWEQAQKRLFLEQLTEIIRDHESL